MGQWSNPREDEVEVSEWDLALGTNRDSVMGHCTTQPDLRVQRNLDIGFSLCTVLTYYYGV